MSPLDEDAFALDERASLGNAWARYASLLLGIWLFVSAFAWPHSHDASAASWIMGASVAMNAFAAIWAPPARYFNTVLGLLALGWHLTAAADQTATLVNGVLVSGLVILLSLVPPRRRPTHPSGSAVTLAGVPGGRLASPRNGAVASIPDSGRKHAALGRLGARRQR